ncbi:MAG: hypothetical protein J7521_20480 [Caulobacter sp.]|nr:hypothetical protein [Caulobacter sp.]
MTKRPKTLDDVDWERATDAFVKSARNMTMGEMLAYAEGAARQLDREGQPDGARVYHQLAAVLRRRAAH